MTIVKPFCKKCSFIKSKPDKNFHKIALLQKHTTQKNVLEKFTSPCNDPVIPRRPHCPLRTVT
jgi:hypothetical protein